MPLPISTLELKSRLLAENLITAERFDAYTREAERKSQSLLDLLVSERVVEQGYLNTLIAESLGVELANLGQREIDKQAFTLLEEGISRQRQAIVFGREADGTLEVAMGDPSDLETIGFLEQHLKAKIRPFLATADDLNRGFLIYSREASSDFKRTIEENVQASLQGQTKTGEEAAADLPIVSIVENILSYAFSSRASDIHLEILDETAMIRYRIDGILYEIMKFPKSVYPALVARIKLLAGLKIDEHYIPQDGRFRYHLVNQAIDVRVSVMPTYYGEKAEMRLLEATQKPLSLEEVGMLSEMGSVVSESLKKSYGMVLVCGPTGSGKTTTLYAMVNILNQPHLNIVTIEDPIEYNMRYVNQTQINPQAGLTFASALRSFLRQDPNVIMVGEIRDRETAEIGVQAALTGHLLLSSLHTNDAASAIPRFFDFGIPPFLVASTLNVIIAQRLVRRICNVCIRSERAIPEFVGVISAQLKELGIRESEHQIPKVFYTGRGCDACGRTGYRGRLAIFEVLPVNEKIKKIITDSQFRLASLKEGARAEGMRTMFEDGLQKIQLGLTTVEEVLRVVRE